MTAWSLETVAATRADTPLRRRYGRWAVVTGASDGIGRAFAHRLAAAGLDLVLVARRGDVLHALATELSRRFGVEVQVVAADLGQRDGVAEVVDRTRTLEVGLLVAAAGFGTSGAFLDADLEQERDLLQVNCWAVLELAQVFGRRFADQGRGGLVLMSSLLGFQGVPLAAHYAATKAYVQTLAEALHVELARRGVQVIASAPGPTHSGFADRAGMTMGFAVRPDSVAEGTLAALGRRSTVRPGWLSWLLELSLAILPRWGRVRVLGQVMRNMTATQARS